ncbi:hypothetical protein DICPUDRAFT_156259 [Dictyostelium purpureum]|uniref:Uncharacterized protein n=1 Tax=Dictyostelium purpureum TaxID=5786 RepID=F0ZW46_DICPU|nr:uncharacterized protein DICPUDRAFT_156259 [Dictyostelium purpureum]EGC31835.1 hypothetical protein DICPUDRAFT_156259 [Dictyostelium purpureum]|eukprot:XP_003291636.1 hypothetical protein DICPUDRAFT_156259 [Dictyostelium purpureum]
MNINILVKTSLFFSILSLLSIISINIPLYVYHDYRGGYDYKKMKFYFEYFTEYNSIKSYPSFEAIDNLLMACRIVLYISVLFNSITIILQLFLDHFNRKVTVSITVFSGCKTLAWMATLAILFYASSYIAVDNEYWESTPNSKVYGGYYENNQKIVAWGPGAGGGLIIFSVIISILQLSIDVFICVQFFKKNQKQTSATKTL